MTSSPRRAWRTRRSIGGLAPVEVLMVVGMGRHGADEPCGRDNNSGRFHSFQILLFPSLSIKNMYDVRTSSP